jgi:AcrR family transcriptional regulator
MISSAALLIRERGAEATSFNDVLAHSGAPRGSIYHHFPGGKAQLIEEATVAACDEYDALFAVIETMDAHQAVSVMLDYWRTQVETTNYSAGCPVAAAALSGDDMSAARERAGAGFAAWTGMIENMLLTSGVPASRAPSMASLILSTVEGAVIVSLAQRSMEPIERAAKELLNVIDASRA